jgi:L-fuculose-phosphate aldolase
VSSEARLREEIVAYCAALHHKGYLAANDGNVSARLGKGRVLITPTGTHKGFLRPEELVVIDESGRLLEGSGKPSGETAMHVTALRLRPDVDVVVHAHPPTCIAVSMVRGLKLNGFLPRVILSIGELVVVPYARPISQDLGDSIEGYVERHDALILERHGTLTVGKSVHDAYSLVERLEHAAQVIHLAWQVGRPTPLPREEEAALREIFEASKR